MFESEQSSHSEPGAGAADAQTEGVRSPTVPPVAIVVSRYNATVTDALLSGAVRAYERAGGEVRDLYVIEAAGSFELVALAHAAARTRRFEGVLALGCIIKGETRHDEFLAHAVTQGLANITLTTDVPVGLGVLTVNNQQQALARAGLGGAAKRRRRAGDGAGSAALGNKGEEAMLALLRTAQDVIALQDLEGLDEAIRGGLTLQRLMKSGDGAWAASPDKLARQWPNSTRSTKRAGSTRQGKATRKGGR